MVVARFCKKPFLSMSQDDVRELLVELKNNPPEVSWFTKERVRNSTLNRSDLLLDDEIDLLAGATGDAQDSAFVRVLDDAGGRITKILTLRIGDVEERPYGFRLNVWASKTCPPRPYREVGSSTSQMALGASL